MRPSAEFWQLEFGCGSRHHKTMSCSGVRWPVDETSDPLVQPAYTYVVENSAVQVMQWMVFILLPSHTGQFQQAACRCWYYIQRVNPSAFWYLVLEPKVDDRPCGCAHFASRLRRSCRFRDLRSDWGRFYNTSFYRPTNSCPAQGSRVEQQWQAAEPGHAAKDLGARPATCTLQCFRYQPQHMSPEPATTGDAGGLPGSRRDFFGSLWLKSACSGGVCGVATGGCSRVESLRNSPLKCECRDRVATGRTKLKNPLLLRVKFMIELWCLVDCKMVCKMMIHCARNARGLYGEALRLKDFQSKDKKQDMLEKKWICEKLKELSAKQKKLGEEEGGPLILENIDLPGFLKRVLLSGLVSRLANWPACPDKPPSPSPAVPCTTATLPTLGVTRLYTDSEESHHFTPAAAAIGIRLRAGSQGAVMAIISVKLKERKGCGVKEGKGCGERNEPELCEKIKCNSKDGEEDLYGFESIVSNDKVEGEETSDFITSKDQESAEEKFAQLVRKLGPVTVIRCSNAGKTPSVMSIIRAQLQCYVLLGTKPGVITIQSKASGFHPMTRWRPADGLFSTGFGRRTS
ncbi:hypothetical protein PR048_005312 [Dryococelus australis]|uniref:Uncharacterized protein n=1 Tax=Dryococelus australis TaxID=614101 RepID=A0ABQ9I8R3_9NEOP|nr:hypothetical protein PR048_005312 [Dryococelus australis]